MSVFFCGVCGTTLYKHGGSKRFKKFFVVMWVTLDGEEGGVEGDMQGEGKGKMGIDIEVPDEEYWKRLRAGWVGPSEGCRQFEGFA